VGTDRITRLAPAKLSEVCVALRWRHGLLILLEKGAAVAPATPPMISPPFAASIHYDSGGQVQRLPG